MDRRTKFLVGATVIVVAVSYLIYSAARETSAYYLTMDEFAARQATLAGQSLRVAGRVTSGSVNWNPKTLDLAFSIQPIPPKDAPKEKLAVATRDDNRASTVLPVRYNGILPDMFADGRDVIVEGRYENGVFHAKSLLTTCPSKYEAEDRYEAEKGEGGDVAAREGGGVAAVAATEAR